MKTAPTFHESPADCLVGEFVIRDKYEPWANRPGPHYFFPPEFVTETFEEFMAGDYREEKPINQERWFFEPDAYFIKGEKVRLWKRTS